MSNSLSALLLAALVLIALIGPGQLLARIFRIPFHKRAEEWLFGLALGLGLLETLLYILGLAHAIDPVTAWAIFLLCLLTTALLNRTVLAGLPRPTKLVQVGSVLRRLRDLLFLVPFAAIVALFLARITTVGVPVMEGDSLSSYLALPREWAQIGYIRFQEFGFQSLFTYSPLNGMMLWMFGFLLRGPIGGEALNQALHLLLGLGVLVLVYRLAVQTLGAPVGRRVGLLAAAAFYSMPVISYIASSLRTDLSWAYLDTAALVAMLLWSQDRELSNRKLLLSGLCLGFAVASRWTPFLSVMGSCAFVFYWLNQNRVRLKESTRALLSLLTPVIVLAGHFFLRNWFIHGNPIYTASSGWSFPDRPGLELLRLPLDAAMLFFQFSFRITTSKLGLGWTSEPFGPFVIMLLPFLFLLPGLPKRAWGLLLYGLTAVAAWFFAGTTTYHLFTALVSVFVVVGYGFIRLADVCPRAHHIVLSALALLFAVQVAREVRLTASFDRLPFLVGRISREQYYATLLPRYTAYPDWKIVRFINDELPPGSRVLMVPHHFPYFFDIPQVTIPLGANWMNPEEVLGFMDREGVTHVFINTASEQGRSWGFGASVFARPDFLTSHFDLLVGNNGHFLYRYGGR